MPDIDACLTIIVSAMIQAVYPNQSMYTMSSRLIGLRRNASHNGLMNLVYNRFYYGQIRRINLLRHRPSRQSHALK